MCPPRPCATCPPACEPADGQPAPSPDALYADRGYDHDKYRKQVREAGIKPVVARRGEQHDSGLGVYRWVVEQGFALLHWFRRLRIRWEIRDDIHEAFLRFACATICWRNWPVALDTGGYEHAPARTTLHVKKRPARRAPGAAATGATS
jgi:transposase